MTDKTLKNLNPEDDSDSWFGELHPLPRFTVCPECGNKRCPHNDNKLMACSHSNELNQVGVLKENLPLAFQKAVKPWVLACFGEDIANDKVERNHRFAEESLELVQSLGCTAKEAHQLVDYVFSRPVGEPKQETGGVMVTLAALCLANNMDMHVEGFTELSRVWGRIELIRAKQLAKPKFGPLPL